MLRLIFLSDHFSSIEIPACLLCKNKTSIVLPHPLAECVREKLRHFVGRILRGTTMSLCAVSTSQGVLDIVPDEVGRPYLRPNQGQIERDVCKLRRLLQLVSHHPSLSVMVRRSYDSMSLPDQLLAQHLLGLSHRVLSFGVHRCHLKLLLHPRPLLLIPTQRMRHVRS